MKPIIVASSFVLSIALGITAAYAGGKGSSPGLGVGSGPPSSLPATNHATTLGLSEPRGLGVAAGAGGLNGGTEPPGWGKADSTPSPAWNGSLVAPSPPPFR
jgi:hypothetical protein